METGGFSLLTSPWSHNSLGVSQDKERKYMLQLPFRQMFVLPSHYVNDYAWKPEPEICV